ncbi:hypothetical protein Dfri01_46750 [Dyadobacter frigoris]|uniref:nuclear transport factor 2 family protein n=1 Tax=Dyadobacter frigoris TaxID=2576211 RepID=UPI0024A193A7|nr:nuclear transport factor 2 family protein [Dyadobacter frigoris]GLU55214.1 hypothetical protein Dfri01_46750 [Dyadobacter frigoris]
MMTQPEKNKVFVLEAFDQAFNKRNEDAYEQYWSPNYIQHSAHIPQGRDGLKNLIAACPKDMKYEHGLVMAEGDYVMIHGRFSNIGQPKAWVTLDVVRMEDGKLAEHWDVIQDEVSQTDSKSGKPMFGNSFSEL